MSNIATHWAETAPVADSYERLILLSLCWRASDDGTGAWPAVARMAATSLCDTRTVHRRLRAMQQRGLIARGDQRLVAHLRQDQRPVVYDVLIPRSWYSDAQWSQLQENRTRLGQTPLDPATRPDIASPAQKGRAKRADTGKKNPARSRKQHPVSDTGCLSDTPQESTDEVSNSHLAGCLTVTTPMSKRHPNPSLNPSQGILPPPSPPPGKTEPRDGQEEDEETSTENTHEHDQEPETTAAAELLRAWARFRPGKFLSPQARAECERLVGEHLAAGVDPDRLGRYVQDWASQAQNPSTWLPMQLRELQAPAARSAPAGARSTAEVGTASAGVKRSDEFTAEDLLARGLNPSLLPSRFRKEHTA